MGNLDTRLRQDRAAFVKRDIKISLYRYVELVGHAAQRKAAPMACIGAAEKSVLLAGGRPQ
jgi:hypothetical protein